MIEAALSLFQKQGYQGTSWRDVVKEAGTPWGSAHHFFPGGKEQLATEALALFLRKFKERFEGICAEHHDAPGRITTWFEHMAVDMEVMGFQAGCGVAGVALDTVPMSASLSQLCSDTMDDWASYLAGKFTLEAVSPIKARGFAEMALTMMEGALVTSRIYRNAGSLRETGAFLVRHWELQYSPRVSFSVIPPSFS